MARGNPPRKLHPRRRRLMEMGDGNENGSKKDSSSGGKAPSGTNAFNGRHINIDGKMPDKDKDDDMTYEQSEEFDWQEYERVQRESFSARFDFIRCSVEGEMLEVENPDSLISRLWTFWFYVYYTIELEWERYTPFFHPFFAAVLLHLAVTTLELKHVCIFSSTEVSLDDEAITVCKKRDLISDECLKSEPLTEKDIKRLEVFSFITSALYYAAQLIPIAVPLIYLAYLFRTKDPKLRYDERIFGAT